MKNKPGLKIIAQNEGSKKINKNIIKNIKKWMKKYKDTINNFYSKKEKAKIKEKRNKYNNKNEEKFNKNKKEKLNNKKEEDLIIIPYKEDTKKEEVERRIVFKDPYRIKDVKLLRTNYLTYHQRKKIKEYIERLENMNIEENKRETKQIIEIQSIKNDYNKYIKDNPNKKEISYNFKTDPCFINFIIVILTNGETYIFQPFSNMTLKSFLNKGNNSYLYKKLDSGHLNIFFYYINIILKKNHNELNNEFTFNNFNVYKLDSDNININNKNELCNVLRSIYDQMRESSDFTDTTDSDSIYKGSTSQEIVSSSYISESNDDNHSKFSDIDIDNSFHSSISEINDGDLSLISEINTKGNNSVQNSHTSIISNNSSSFMDFSDCSIVEDDNDISFITETDDKSNSSVQNVSIISSNNDSPINYISCKSPMNSVERTKKENLNFSIAENQNVLISEKTNNQVTKINQNNTPLIIFNNQNSINNYCNCGDIELYGKKYTNVIIDNVVWLGKFTNDGFLIIGYYEKYQNDHNLYLKIDSELVLCYDIEDNFIQVLNDAVLKDKIERINYSKN